MNPLRALTRSEYAFRPRQVFTRLCRALTARPACAEVRLPWGDTVRVCPHETIGSDIWHLGLFDLPVAEVLWRLLETGERALDIGANLGQMTSLLRCKAGPTGHVIAFEPHQELFAALEFLRDAPVNQRRVAPLGLVQAGLSDAAGQAWLDPGPQWAANRGLSRVVTAANGPRGVSIELKTLDECVPPDARIGVAKLDVEGHELAVLRGATRILASGAVRDWVFEDLGAQPSAATALFQTHGYAIFVLQTRWRGPGLRALNATASGADLPHNFLATRAPERARERLASGGWHVLRGA